MKFMLVAFFFLTSCASWLNVDRSNKPKEKPVKSDEKVSVFKYDGSVQCGQDKGMGLDLMGKELLGIKIISSEKKSDGLMHPMMCGSPTGEANVYQINEKDEKSAESLGFKKWTFDKK